MQNQKGRQPRPALPQLHGVLALDKPSGPTSTACLTAIKRLGQKKIGHAGTLDPLASGVLVVLLGEATKIAPYVMEGEKAYLGELRLGMTTDTYDIQGAVTCEAPWEHVGQAALEAAVAAWTTETEQEVPPYSAAKHQGRPLYELARKGLAAPVKRKQISVFDARLEHIALPSATFRVRVSAGVYIRSLVHSLGKRLGCGAVMTALTREASRPFELRQAHGLEDILADPQSLPGRVIPLEADRHAWRRRRRPGAPGRARARRARCRRRGKRPALRRGLPAPGPGQGRGSGRWTQVGHPARSVRRPATGPARRTHRPRANDHPQHWRIALWL